MKIKLEEVVIFDMDGVIFDSEKCVVECWKEVAEKYNVPDVEAACMECLGVNRQETREKWLRRYGQDFPYDAYKDEMSALFHSRYDQGRLPLKTGVEELLQALKASQIRTAIASSTRQKIVEQEIKDAGLSRYFDHIVGGDAVERSKPAPDIFLKACGLLEVSPKAAYIIEDSYNGVRAAHAAGANPIMVPDLAAPNEEMREIARAILPTLLDVKQYLLQ